MLSQRGLSPIWALLKAQKILHLPIPRLLTSASKPKIGGDAKWAINSQAVLDLIPRTARCEADFVMLSAANQSIMLKFMHNLSRKAGKPSSVKYTFNTDFAQADVDRALNNLPRFNMFFPERRQFFLKTVAFMPVQTSPM